MKVLFDNQIFSSQVAGGISRYFFELISRLQNHSDIEVELPFTYSRNKYLKAAPLPLRRWSLFKRRYFKGQWLLEWPLMQWSQRSNNRSLAQQAYEILHPTYYDPYFLDLIGNRPFVITVHDMIHELYPECFPPKIAEYEQACKRLTVKKATHIIAVSECTKRDLLNLYDIPEDKISVVCHGSPQWNYVPVSTSINERPYLLFVGRREFYKGFHYFFDVVSDLLETLNVDLICAGGEPFSTEEKALFKTCGLSHRVKQFFPADAELNTLYSQAEMFVFPSLYEGFGLPILEAYSCGCPVVLCDNPCFREIAADAAVYFVQKDPDSIRCAIQNVLSKREFRTSLINRGHQRQKLFSWEKCVEQTKAVYQKILS